MLSKEDLHELTLQCRYKERELLEISELVLPDLNERKQSIIIEGMPSSGKTFTITKYLEKMYEKYNTSYINIKCKFCHSQRDVLRQIQKSLLIHYGLAYSNVEKRMTVCNNLDSFPNCLSTMIDHTEKIKPVIIVLDGIDELPENERSGMLVAALSKFHELGEVGFDTLSFISVVTRADFLGIETFNIPIVSFDCYNMDQFKNILCDLLLEKFWSLYDSKNEVGSGSDDSDTEDYETSGENGEISDKKEVKIDETKIITENEKRSFFIQFVDIILQTHEKYIPLCIDIVVPILKKAWPLFIDPLLKTKSIIKGRNDVFSTFMKNKKLLSEEFAIVNKINNTATTLLDFQKSDTNIINNDKAINNIDNKGFYDLSDKTKYLIIASYLASYNEPKFDRQFFSKTGDYNNILKRRKRRIVINDKGIGRMRRKTKAAMAFTLERLLSILNAIWVENVGDDKLINNVELITEIGTLSTLKTLIKTNKGKMSRWKCNVDWKVVKKFSDDVGFEIYNYLQD